MSDTWLGCSVGALRRMGRFMGSGLGLPAMRCGHEPVPPAFQPATAPTGKSAVRVRFMGSVLAPINPAEIMCLAQLGYAADFILELTMDTLNGLRNPATRNRVISGTEESEPESHPPGSWYGHVVGRARGLGLTDSTHLRLHRGLTRVTSQQESGLNESSFRAARRRPLSEPSKAPDRG